MILPILLLGAASFVLCWLLTLLMIRIAPALGLVDRPGGHKVHEMPKPLGGGVAIFWSIAIVMLLGVAAVQFADGRILSFYSNSQTMRDLIAGARSHVPLSLGLLGAMLAMHLMGMIDDRRALGALPKLLLQLLISGAVVLIFDMRALTALDHLGLGRWPSVVITMMWIVAITNAFNFLDNMDGLSAGVAAVCTTAFLVTTLSIQQWFVAATLSMLLGSLLGFLIWNFPPASIFMGDSGSLVIGFVLGVLTIRTTFLARGADFRAGWYGVLAPLIVMALPLYDLVVVSMIRLSRGKSPFVGDTNHFSHRLVARGMSRRTAVLCLYLVTAATSIAAILLPHVSGAWAAGLIFCQTLLVLSLVALLEQHPLPQQQK
jgi:UDP-GlcNAc:undecaprenyl-phosphate GlcNAc-1-phosphate transferase